MNRLNITKILTIAGVCFLMVLLVFISGCFGGGTTEEDRAIREQEREKEQAERETLAWKMAVIGEDGFVPYGGDLEKEYEWYLNKLAEKTKQDKKEVADITVNAWNIISEEVNPKENLLDVLQDLYNVVPRGSENIDLKEVAGLYVILRINE